MSVILRWLLRIFTVAMIVLAISATLGWYLVLGSLPDYDTKLSLSGIDAEIRITRDANAVPHIRATTDRDAFFADQRNVSAAESCIRRSLEALLDLGLNEPCSSAWDCQFHTQCEYPNLVSCGHHQCTILLQFRNHFTR